MSGRLTNRVVACALGTIGVVACGAIVTGCSAKPESGTLAIDLIDDAIAAVDDHFGSATDFYEINATADGVNLFVSTTGDDARPAVVQARYTSADGLVVADEAAPAEGSVFSGSAVDFDPKTIIERAVGQLSSAEPQVFIITAASDGSGAIDTSVATYRLVMESRRGGRLVVFLGRDGTILGSDFVE